MESDSAEMKFTRHSLADCHQSGVTTCAGNVSISRLRLCCSFFLAEYAMCLSIRVERGCIGDFEMKEIEKRSLHKKTEIKSNIFFCIFIILLCLKVAHRILKKIFKKF